MIPFAPKGFTLIELLVVIAIIGILAGIVLVSLGNARQKGADAGIQGNLDSIRTQAEVYANNNGYVYGTQAIDLPTTAGAACGSAGMWADPTISQATKAATNSGGSATLQGFSNRIAVCFSTSNFWALAVVLKTDPTKLWCVDSNGKANTINVSSIDASSGETFVGC
ncbi:hypothetical protein A3D70_00370 [Candidatus Adlerbacteria bacterium RIFCSPHIGHO2_02_FULL_54_18]|uniref:Type II secretion system protein GspG C-terminal domain-containing protein n=2 Tax=Candidatus Adleribacteriota TaxID=1752736 RepID=A0A1F4Y265_9BACT|nr:MAG: hypothetical protein A2949_00280 [Candidatus Adlerbacteria bacterium RIFCSPLOWO2_01_FULL_54_21b]OGC88065.1 MAG: hypothetical protein A3D70_00370 [Candidatus Adlerbacteria bacterium RIFCSPHIGHO2_02_FULL_54_18]